ncbi:MAG: DUF2846 domain-containing protein [Proteobacteria bacterium]|nr:DUF2846 domain-containing protein [Pseudomonadota bacterium]
MRERVAASFCAFILLILLSACTPKVPLALPEHDAEARRMKPPPGRALLYVYRGDVLFSGKAAIYDVFIDDHRIGALAERTYLTIYSNPGKYMFSYGASYPDTIYKKSELPLYVKADQVYFVEISAWNAMLIEESKAVKNLENCRLIFETDSPFELASIQNKKARTGPNTSPTVPPAGTAKAEGFQTASQAGGKKQGEQVKMAVMELEAIGGVDNDLAEIMTSYLKDEIHALGSYSTVSREEIEALANRLSLQQLVGDCTDNNCLSDMGKALGTKLMVYGSISLVGETFSLSLRLLDTESKEPVNRVNRLCKCKKDDLFEVVRSAVIELMQ